MTIASTISKTLYAGNGSTTAFAIPFPFIANQDLEVVLSGADGERVLTLGTDYQLSGAGESGGGTCTLTTPPATGETLVIRRDPAPVQEVDYVENDAFPASTHEGALDKLTMICQALAERLDRTITFRVSSAVSGVQLPDPAPGRVLGWNGGGDDLSNLDLAALGEIALPLAVSQGGTGATESAQALANLGFGTTGRLVAGAATPGEARAAMGAEPADTAILKAEEAALLMAVFGDQAQAHTGADLSALAVNRNHVSWSLTAASIFSDVTLPYDGTYVFHVYPGGNGLSLAASYKTDGNLADPDSAAGEIRIVVERFNARKTIVALQNMEA
ncbi:phage tail fiber protein [Pseudodesulfovibrio sp.]|uniref:phage tail fiber protein n=1 Tax=Pseudodesulfovibrio sp. TaxID=2035812 RepID=UPI0026392A49|nr:phage tail fiber protein [Pseudodesulfovibrio sp.]MDD3311303.1 phage tail fiber protein [Pseudodesulfovibrio sp.]